VTIDRARVPAAAGAARDRRPTAPDLSCAPSAADAPPALVITLTGTITLVLAVVAWRAALESTRARIAGLAAILGGAVANVVDRAGGGVVTDHLHTGWWPTFDLADTAIITGAVLVVLTSWQRPADRGNDAHRLRTPSPGSPSSGGGSTAGTYPHSPLDR
jgi:signal peptidase II